MHTVSSVLAAVDTFHLVRIRSQKFQLLCPTSSSDLLCVSVEYWLSNFNNWDFRDFFRDLISDRDMFSRCVFGHHFFLSREGSLGYCFNKLGKKLSVLRLNIICARLKPVSWRGVFFVRVWLHRVITILVSFDQQGFHYLHGGLCFAFSTLMNGWWCTMGNTQACHEYVKPLTGKLGPPSDKITLGMPYRAKCFLRTVIRVLVWLVSEPVSMKLE